MAKSLNTLEMERHQKQWIWLVPPKGISASDGTGRERWGVDRVVINCDDLMICWVVDQGWCASSASAESTSWFAQVMLKYSGCAERSSVNETCIFLCDNLGWWLNTNWKVVALHFEKLQQAQITGWSESVSVKLIKNYATADREGLVLLRIPICIIIINNCQPFFSSWPSS